MGDSQKQALQRFFAFLIAEVITFVVAILSSPKVAELVTDLAGEGSLVATLILALLPPIIGALGKLQAGPTVKATEAHGRGADGEVAGESPGLFG